VPSGRGPWHGLRDGGAFLDSGPGSRSGDVSRDAINYGRLHYSLENVRFLRLALGQARKHSGV
jgi:hypothetical protein